MRSVLFLWAMSIAATEVSAQDDPRMQILLDGGIGSSWFKQAGSDNPYMATYQGDGMNHRVGAQVRVGLSESFAVRWGLLASRRSFASTSYVFQWQIPAYEWVPVRYDQRTTITTVGMSFLAEWRPVRWASLLGGIQPIGEIDRNTRNELGEPQPVGFKQGKIEWVAGLEVWPVERLGLTFRYYHQPKPVSTQQLLVSGTQHLRTTHWRTIEAGAAFLLADVAAKPKDREPKDHAVGTGGEKPKYPVEALIEVASGHAGFVTTGTTHPLMDSLFARGTNARFAFHLRVRVGERFALRTGAGAGWRDFGARYVTRFTSISSTPVTYSVKPELKATASYINFPLLVEYMPKPRLALHAGVQLMNTRSIQGAFVFNMERLKGRGTQGTLEGIAGAEYRIGWNWGVGARYTHGLSPMWTHRYFASEVPTYRDRQFLWSVLEGTLHLRIDQRGRKHGMVPE